MSEHAMQQHHESARNAYETGRLRVAMSIIQECLHADSDDGRAWELSGLVHYSSGRYRQAVSLWSVLSVWYRCGLPGKSVSGMPMAKRDCAMCLETLSWN